MNKVFKNAGKCCILSILLSCSSIQIVYGQTARVTMEAKDITLNELLSEIRKQTGYDFVFTSSKLDFNRKVSPKFKDAPMQAVLSNYFNANAGVIYIIKNKTIVLIDEDKAQDKIVQGQVLSATNKQPIAGATISIKEKKISTKTDARGNFLLNIPEYAQQLEVNFMGYKTELVPITASVKYEIALEESTEDIDEVVVTGIFERKAENFTGAARTISGEELKKISTNNIFAGISAIEPSFRILPNDVLGGNINQLPDIQLRGQNSLPNLGGELASNPNQPLFILDGFEVGLQRIVDLDMNMIASITILKDASATAIYGSRGANGVMVVNTIAPKPGKIQVTLNNDFRLSTPDLSVYNYLNAVEKLDFEQRVGVYNSDFDQTKYRLDNLYNERYKNTQRGIDTDWKKIPTQIGYNNRTSVNLQGGDEHIRYGILAASDLQQGVMKGQDRKNYSGQFDLTYLVNKLQFKNSIRVYQNIANESPYGNFSTYLNMNPYWTPYDVDGNVQRYLENYTFIGQSYRTTNPMYNATLHSVNQSKYIGFTNNFQIRYNLTPSLYIESNLGLTRQNGGTDQFYSADDSRFENTTDINRKGSYTDRNDESSSYESVTNLNYNFKRAKHQWFSTASFNMSNSSNAYTEIVAEGFPYDRLDNLLFANQYQQNGRPTGDESTVRRVGLLYSGNYSYDNRFLVDLSVKYDGSSQYGTDKRFGTFWSTGLGWNIHNEKFFQQNDFVNRLKLRGSYGTTGSLNIPAYSGQTRYNFGVSSGYYNELGANIGNLGNKLLSWQTVYKLNLGLDIMLLNERLDIRLDAYRDLTNDAITQITLAPSTGFSSYSENLGKVENKGFEYAVRYKVIENKNTGTVWSLFVNGFTNRNVLKEISNALKASNDRLNENNVAQTVPNILLQEGNSMDAIYVVRSLGVDPITGSEIFITKNGERTYDWDASDKVAFGVSIPKWNGNFGTNLNHKGFELGVVFNYQFGGQLYNQTLINKVESVIPSNNVDRRAYDLGWTGPGDISQFTRIGLNTIPTRLTSRFVQDNNNLTLSTLSFGYNFYRQNWVKRAGLRSFQLTALTNDLVRFSSIEIERGTSNPFARTFALSIRVGI
ncbi:TonB-linked outer membrane protein, SusC/RagA family [Sphingobacterium nematocida]|uniref:TonB-linked outer membrane protein, SusC/RagA family n=1 Tax=Sphingobacterium nematocida TaxID=1513896 RepID=A0A1T5DX74_9SPHI|nr:SusC/RagA family TonB-linked outer membrane protein [Sphingobacterium nematocida]SKB76257.1 TonB-linked outer membrane protein, SusC/RagA family [Sphingobacterium nematocida]